MDIYMFSYVFDLYIQSFHVYFFIIFKLGPFENMYVVVHSFPA